jgi:hypothetical protein
MIVIKINSDISVYVTKEQDADTYEIVSGDSEGHEGRLASGVTTIAELFDVLKEYFDV